MFLNALNKQEAVALVNLISEFAISDHKICLEEKALIEEACEEMGLPDDGLESMEYDEAMAILKKSEYRIKAIVYFELIRLGLVDDDYDVQEVEFLNKVSDELGITRPDRFAFAGYFYKYSDTDRLDTDQAKSDANAILK